MRRKDKDKERKEGGRERVRERKKGNLRIMYCRRHGSLNFQCHHHYLYFKFIMVPSISFSIQFYKKREIKIQVKKRWISNITNSNHVLKFRKYTFMYTHIQYINIHAYNKTKTNKIVYLTLRSEEGRFVNINVNPTITN